jgi:hypothetical protein
MPQIHGHFLINQLKSTPNLDKIPILIITSIQELNLIDVINPHKIIYEPVSEKILINSIEEIVKIRINIFPIDRLVFYDSVNHLKDFFSSDDQFFHTKWEESSKLILSRRKVQNLILDEIEPDGNNLKIIKWLKDNPDFLPEKITYIYSEKPNNLVKNELLNLKNCKLLDLDSIIKVNSFDEALNKV